MSIPSEAERAVREKLLWEYESRSPVYERAVTIVKATLEYRLLGLTSALRPYERLEIVGRVKTFESAFRKIRPGQESKSFDPDKLSDYTLGSLNDMAGVKVRVFPNIRLPAIHRVITSEFPDCEQDHDPTDSPPGSDDVNRLKYFVRLPCEHLTDCLCEIQVVPWMLDRYWEIEHEVLYKPQLSLSRRVRQELEMTDMAIVNSLKAFTRTLAGILETEPGAYEHPDSE